MTPAIDDCDDVMPTRQRWPGWVQVVAVLGMFSFFAAGYGIGWTRGEATGYTDGKNWVIDYHDLRPAPGPEGVPSK